MAKKTAKKDTTKTRRKGRPPLSANHRKTARLEIKMREDQREALAQAFEKSGEPYESPFLLSVLMDGLRSRKLIV